MLAALFPQQCKKKADWPLESISQGLKETGSGFDSLLTCYMRLAEDGTLNELAQPCIITGMVFLDRVGWHM